MVVFSSHGKILKKEEYKIFQNERTTILKGENDSIKIFKNMIVVKNMDYTLIYEKNKQTILNILNILMYVDTKEIQIDKTFVQINYELLDEKRQLIEKRQLRIDWSDNGTR